MPEPSRRDRGALEAEVLAAVGSAGRALTPAQALAELGGGLAYTTVMTTLARLHEKGALTRRRSGRAYAYTLAGTAQTVGASLTARQMRRLLDGRADRASVLARFVAELSPADERLLAALLDEPRGEQAGEQARDG